MDSAFKFLSFGASVVVYSLLAGCSEGTESAATGGGSSVGGGSATGGANTGTGGTAAVATKLYTFDENQQGFALNESPSMDPLYVNLAAPGDVTVPGPTPTLLWGSKDYDAASPTPGSIQIKATFSHWNQSVSAEVSGPIDLTGAPLDLTDSTLTAQIWVDAGGLSPEVSAPGGAVFFIKSGSAYVWGQAPWTNLIAPGMWTNVRFNTSNADMGTADGWDPSNPFQLGFQISSGGGGTLCPDITDPVACPAWAAPLPTTIYIDNVTVRKN